MQKQPASSSSTTMTIATTEAGTRLYEQAKAMQERRESRMKEKPADCTFSPKLVTSTRRAGKTGASATNEEEDPLASTTKRFERLYLDAQTRAAKLEGAKKEHEKTLAAQVPRKPYTILPPSFTTKTKTSSSRKPPSSPASSSHAPSSISAGVNRLYEQAKLQRERQAQRVAEATANECTFKPVILPRSASTRRRRQGEGGKEEGKEDGGGFIVVRGAGHVVSEKS